MDWSRIDSPLARIQHLVSRTQCRYSSAVHRRAQTQNRENNPMQSRIGPARSTRAACVRRTRWSVVTAQPDLILLWRLAIFANTARFGPLDPDGVSSFVSPGLPAGRGGSPFQPANNRRLPVQAGQVRPDAGAAAP